MSGAEENTMLNYSVTNNQQGTIMQTQLNCPRCGARIQGDYGHFAALPHHLTADADVPDMILCEPGTPNCCEASGYLLATVPAEKGAA